MTKLLENIVGPWENVLTLVTAVALVWLLMREMSISVQFSKQGFSTESNYMNMLETQGRVKMTANRV
mgnify:FL=1